MHYALCMAGERWISGFVWHQKIMDTQYHPRGMMFILTLHNLITLISHCLVPYSYPRPKVNISNQKKSSGNYCQKLLEFLSVLSVAASRPTCDNESNACYQYRQQINMWSPLKSFFLQNLCFINGVVGKKTIAGRTMAK